MVTKTEEWFKPISITFFGDILKDLAEPALMFAVFGYREAMFGVMVECALQSDFPIINMLYCSYPLYVEIKKGNLTVRNYETENKKGAEERQATNPWCH